ncbi:MAG: endonuclease/exonuclease/phosphatase family protein [Myxococcota bacterium]|nr:endonuclease/exonuclease/phosphatase family protein [Myxococcota bacterium]
MRRWALSIFVLTALGCSGAALNGTPSTSEATRPATTPKPTGQAELTLLSWNVEWLDVAGQGMVPRSAAELQEMAQVIRSAQPDVVVLQEVASEEAARALLPKGDWQLAVEDRSDDQRVVVAVRQGLAFERRADLRPLAVGNPGLRHGVDVQVQTAAGPVRVLGVHLKAGCQWDPFDSSQECGTLERQAAVLETWTDARATEGVPMVVVGDFNRQMHAQDPFYLAVSDGEPAGLHLSLGPTKDAQCEPKRRHPIDHLLVSGARVGESRQIPLQQPPLSDHCPIVATLEL